MEVTKNDIEQLIELRKKDNFFNHLLTVLFRDYNSNGDIRQHEIRIWRQHLWNALFYPVFTFELNKNNHLVKISARLNPVGRFFLVTGLIGFTLAILPADILDFDLRSDLGLPVVLIFFISTALLILRLIYRFERRKQLELFVELLDIKTELMEPESEWSLKNILVRLITYPLCLFFIWINIILFIPDGEYIFVLGSLLPVAMYLIADLLLIFKIGDF